MIIFISTLFFLFCIVCQPGGNQSHPKKYYRYQRLQPLITLTIKPNDSNPSEAFNKHTHNWSQSNIDANCVVIPCVRGTCPPRCGNCDKNEMCSRSQLFNGEENESTVKLKIHHRKDDDDKDKYNGNGKWKIKDRPRSGTYVTHKDLT